MSTKKLPTKEGIVESFINAQKSRYAYDTLINQTKTIKGQRYDIAKNVGIFVIGAQRLEQLLKLMVWITYNSSLSYRGDLYKVYRSPYRPFNKNAPLGKIIELIKAVNVYDLKTRENIMTDFKRKLGVYNTQRNNYIHNLLESRNTLDIRVVKASLKTANKELNDLNAEALTILSIMKQSRDESDVLGTLLKKRAKKRFLPEQQE